MDQKAIRRSATGRELTGTAIEAQGRTLQLVARVSGSGWSFGQEGAAGWLRVVPTEVVVTEQDGRVYHVPIKMPNRHARRWMALGGALLLPLGWLLRRAARGK